MPGPGPANRLRFGRFLVDLTTGELFCDGAKVPLQDKPFQILELLLRRPKELVSRNEIIRSVWPDTFVEGDLCLNVAVNRLRAALKDDPAQPQFVETVGSHGYRFIGVIHALPTPDIAPAARDHPRLAIFPLKSFVRPKYQWLAPSVTEQIITQLRRSAPLPVIITPEFTTERTPKGRSVATLCRRVFADYVLVGAVLESGGQLRIIARLLNCHAQSCIWAESYQLSSSATQEDAVNKIAAAVLRSIPIPLRPPDLQLVTAAAHENYLKAAALFAMLTEAGIEKSIALFELAVRECPRFALAWAALGNACCAHARIGVLPARKAFPEARRCAEKSLEIEDLAEGRTALANYHMFYDHDFHAAEADLIRALSIDSGCQLALGSYAQLLAIVGRHEDGIDMMRRGCDLDPFSCYNRILLGWSLYYAGDYDQALSQLQRALELHPALWFAHTSVGMVLDQMGNTTAALPEFRIAVEHSENSSLARAHLAYGLARSGNRTEAAQILESLLKLRQKKYFSPYWLAVLYVGLNDRDEALKWLNTARAEHCCWLLFGRQDPTFAPLRALPSFQQITDDLQAPFSTPGKRR
jgi:DNA-binding winged helix-turn-helix (wHTH) protein/tetratricopeptide (TPR) repeat protein